MISHSLNEIVLLLGENILRSDGRSGRAGELSSGEFKRRAGRSPILHNIRSAAKGLRP